MKLVFKRTTATGDDHPGAGGLRLGGRDVVFGKQRFFGVGAVCAWEVGERRRERQRSTWDHVARGDGTRGVKLKVLDRAFIEGIVRNRW